jgi:hypothetical protein
MPRVYIVTNNEEDGDWNRVFIDGKEFRLSSGHTISKSDIISILEKLGIAAEEVSLDNESVEKWTPPKEKPKAEFCTSMYGHELRCIREPGHDGDHFDHQTGISWENRRSRR